MARLLPLALLLVLSLAASSARAAPAFTVDHGTLSGHVGFGSILDDDDYADLNPYGFGLGARGGYTIRPGVYIGGLFDFFVGDSEDTSVGGIANAEVSANLWLFQLEGGYDFGVTRSIVIRPKLGLGVTTVNFEACGNALGVGGCSDDSDGEFAFGLGAEALFDLDPVYIAPEMRFNLGNDISAVIFMVGVGGVL
jgi:hypothetical protein